MTYYEGTVTTNTWDIHVGARRRNQYKGWKGIREKEYVSM